MAVDDDVLLGRVLSRREALGVLAASGAAWLAGAGEGAAGFLDDPLAFQQAGTRLTPACVVRPELTTGPYFVEEQLNRSDVRLEPATGAPSAGVPLVLALTVSELSNGRCAPAAGAVVDVWQCDALGVYSGVSDTRARFNTVGQKFLRGYQVTDARGVCRFTTIYPGWYPGRAVHVHFKIRANPSGGGGGAGGGDGYEFTSQLFFDEALTDRIHAQQPYAKNGRRDRMNAQDSIYREVGEQLLLTPSGQGYASAFTVGLDLADTATGRPDSEGRGGRGARGRGRGGA